MSPAGQQLMSAVYDKYPSFDAGRNSVILDWRKGKQGATVRSFNAAISHANLLSDYVVALDNKDTKLLNKIGNELAVQTGGEAPTNFDAVKQIFADEIARAIIGGQNAEADRAKLQESLSSASSPKQLNGAIKAFKQLMAGQLSASKQAYEFGTDRKDFLNMLTEESKTALDQITQKKSAPSSGFTYLGKE